MLKVVIEITVLAPLQNLEMLDNHYVRLISQTMTGQQRNVLTMNNVKYIIA